MKKRIVLLVLALSIILAIPAYAAATRNAINIPGLSFTGSTAVCTSMIIGPINADIEAEISLWDGNKCIESWSEDAVYRLNFRDTVSVTRGRTYTLKVDATIDGVKQDTVSTSAKCP